MREEKELTNPFYHNYVFSSKDLNRPLIGWRDLLWIWVLPTYVMLSEGYVFYYKSHQGRIFLVDIKNMESGNVCNS